MVNWNSRGIRVGMVLGVNLKVIKVTERQNIRRIFLRLTNLPAGFEANDIVVTVHSSLQDITVKEANQELPE